MNLDNEELCTAWQRDRKPSIRDTLLKNNMRFIYRRTHMWNKPHHFDDLLQEGCIGFLMALDKWEAARNCKVVTCAGWWIYSRQVFFLKKLKSAANIDDVLHHPNLATFSTVEKDIETTQIAPLALDEIHEHLELLPPRDRGMFNMYFFGQETLKEIGDIYGYTSERVRQINDKTLAKIKKRILSREKHAA